MVCMVFPNNKGDRYDSLKRLLCIDYASMLQHQQLLSNKFPVPSQVVLSKTLNNDRAFMGVVGKVAGQMICKLGGALWTVNIPLGNSMIVGYDTYHDSSQKGKSVGATVASLNKECTKYFSIATHHSTSEELTTNFENTIMRKQKLEV